MAVKEMKINVTVPAGDYVLISKTDLGRIVGLLKQEGVFETFKKLDVQARAINYVEPRPTLPGEIKLTTPQKECLTELVELVIVPLYDGTTPMRKYGLNRNTLRALTRKGLLEERQVKREQKGPIQAKRPTVLGYFVTPLGKRIVSRK